MLKKFLKRVTKFFTDALLARGANSHYLGLGILDVPNTAFKIKPIELVQAYDRKKKRYVKLDKNTGRVIATKKSPGRYKNIPIAKGEKAPRIVQVKNPKTGRYVKIDRATAKIISHKKTEGAYKNIPISKNNELRNSEFEE